MTYPPARVRKIALIVLFAMIALGVIVPLTYFSCRLLTTAQGQQILTGTLGALGIFSVPLFILLQIIHIVIAVIPGGPVPLIGGMLFGRIAAIGLCLVGSVAGTAIVYGLVHRFGAPLVRRFVKEKHRRTFSFLQKGDRLEVLIFLVFFLPGLPKDALTYLVCFQARVSLWRLLLITTIARTPSLILTVFLGDSLSGGNFWRAAIFLGAFFVLALTGFLVKQKLSRKTSKGEISDEKQ